MVVKSLNFPVLIKKWVQRRFVRRALGNPWSPGLVLAVEAAEQPQEGWSWGIWPHQGTWRLARTKAELAPPKASLGC